VQAGKAFGEWQQFVAAPVDYVACEYYGIGAECVDFCDKLVAKRCVAAE
jgi:hypothetical protein